MEPSSKTTSRTDARPRRRVALVFAACLAWAAPSAAPGVETGDPATGAAVETAAARPAADSDTTTSATAGAVETAAGPKANSAATPPAAPAAPDATAPPVAPEGGRSPITVEADTLTVDRNEGSRVHASGSVVVEWDGTKLRAADIEVDQSARTVAATGGVQYESDDVRATADDAKLDIDDEVGVLDHVEMHMVGEAGRFGGARLEKSQGRRVIIDDGYFTTCDIDKGHAPDWELRGKQLDVRFDDYARLKSGSLEVRGVPVFYLPYLIFPTKKTRQSGLLPFTIGTSTNRGMIFALPGYWDIDKQQDLTMTAVVETSARLGIDGVYRYAPSRRRWGELHAAYYNEEVRGEAKPGTPAAGVPNDRGLVELIHREHGDFWTGYADIQWVGDDRFLREVNSLEGDAPERDFRRSQRYTTSRLGALFQHGFTSGGIESTAYQDLVGEVVDDGNSTTVDPVHRDVLHKPLNGWLQTDGSAGPVAYAVDSSLASFVRDKGAGGERLDLASTFALPLLTSGPVLSRAWAKGHGSVYAMNQRDVLDGQQQFVERLDAFPTRGVFQAGLDARSKFARNFAFSNSPEWSGLYHSLEPFAAVRYSNRSSWDRIPLFDRLDAIDGRDVTTYGIDSRFLLRRPAGAKNGGPFELGRLSLSQSYNMSREVVNDHFSDIDLSAFVQPIEGLALRTLTSYNVGATQLRGANASISWETGPLGPILRGKSSQIAAAYRYVRSDTANNVLQSAEMLAKLSFTQNIALGLKGLYDIVGKTFVEKAVGFTFTSSCDCWSVGLGVVERVNPSVTGLTGTRNNPEELQVRLAFELKGLGGFGSGITQRNTPALDNVEYEDVGFWRAGW